MNKCPYCGRENPDDLSRCSGCGTPLLVPPSREPVLGKLSLALVGLAGVVIFFAYLRGYGIYGMAYAMLIFVPSAVSALFGVIRHERPCWPAFLGLLLSLAPAISVLSAIALTIFGRF